ncbi:hypothetical protein PSAC2689_10085 [Paraburkholderia sacchari]
MQEVGVKPGDRVAQMSHHAIESVEWMFACWWVGAVFCPLDIRWQNAELVDALQDCEAAVLLHDAAHAPVAEAVAPAVSSIACVLPVDLTISAAPVADMCASDDSLAALIYTGGTTGRSNGVCLTHGCIGAAALTRLADNSPLEDSGALLTTPNYHVAALVRGMTHWAAGGTVVLMPQFRADDAMGVIERERVTDVSFVPTMLQMVLEHSQFRPERLRSVRRMGYGAAPSAQVLLQSAQTLLPWVGMQQHYGMTESCSIGTIRLSSGHRPEDWTSGRAGSAGRAAPAAELRIIDGSGREVPVGQVGEIALRGPFVSPGYWRCAEESRITFRDSWLYRCRSAGRERLRIYSRPN